MNNLNSPAYPRAYEFSAKYDNEVENHEGFTKLELASLMIAANLTPIHYDGIGVTTSQVETITQTSVEVAKAVLEEANK
jgi:hypothetical protein